MSSERILEEAPLHYQILEQWRDKELASWPEELGVLPVNVYSSIKSWDRTKW